MKRKIPLFLAIFLICSILAVPASAAEAAEPAEPGRDSAYYPISVEEYVGGDFDEPRIQKVYQLSLDDDPSLIPRSDFERNGRLYYLLDMTRKDEVGVDTKPHVQTVTRPSDTNNMEKILQALDAEIETVTEDGYTGTLHLDHTTVKVTTDGYATASSQSPLSSVSALRRKLRPLPCSSFSHRTRFAGLRWDIETDSPWRTSSGATPLRRRATAWSPATPPRPGTPGAPPASTPPGTR